MVELAVDEEDGGSDLAAVGWRYTVVTAKENGARRNE